MSAPEPTSERPIVPKWAMKIFDDCIEDLKHQNQLLEVCRRGISGARGMPQLITAVNAALKDPNFDKKIAMANDDADFANREIDRGFPTLHANAALTLWSSLEATIIHFIASYLEHEPSALQSEPVMKLKVSIGEYERHGGKDRFYYIVKRLEDAPGLVFAPGIDRFEPILEAFGFKGSLPRKARRLLLELSHLRNCLMHRAGRVDRAFSDSCPWTKFPPGHRIKVTRKAVNWYHAAGCNYLLELLCRAGIRYGANMDDYRSGINASTEELLEDVDLQTTALE